MLTTGYPHRGDPVAGAFVRGMARSLAARGHAVTVVCAARRGDAPCDDQGVRVVPAAGLSAGVFYGAGAPDAMGLGGAFRPGPWLRGGDATAALGWRAREALADCDALVSHFVLPSGLLAGLLRGGRPHVAVVHGTDGALLARAPGWARRAVLQGATRVWCSHTGLRDVLGLMPSRCWVGPMGYDPPSVGPTAREVGRVVSLGRLVPVKRPVLALEGVMRARAEGHLLSITLLGDGPLRGRLEALGANAAPGAVTFAGAVDAVVRDVWLARAELFVHTAGRGDGWRTEGAPMAVVEAMAAGAVVVATEGGGVAELVGDAGVVLPGDADAAAVGAALGALHRDGAYRAELVARAAQRVAGWRWEAQAARLEAWLREA
jgi:glycosyltransferase involved in cell wall biosynthesis